MKLSISFMMVLVSVGIGVKAQTEEKIEIRALNRQQISRKDTIYRFYAVNQDPPVSARADRVYYWYKSDTILSTRGGYDGRLLHGRYTIFYPDHNLKEDGWFIRGLPSGEWRSWYPGGKLQAIVHWKNGVRSGWFEEYDNTGRRARAGGYKEDEVSGIITVYGEDGTSHKTLYKKGKPVIRQPKKKKVAVEEGDDHA